MAASSTAGPSMPSRLKHVARAVLIAAGCSMYASSVAAAAEQVVETPGPKGPLQGTLLIPAVSSASVLIIPGSGPTNRDGNNPLGVAAATYRLLAEGLAQEGITTLRIDKRGMFGSAAAVPDANAVTIGDYADDVRNWAVFLRKRTGNACTWLLGHSEGGLVGLSAAQPRDGICGLILVSTAGRPMGQVLRDQLKANPANAPLLEQAFAAIMSLESGRRVDATALHPVLAGLFRPEVQGFLIDSLARDPTAQLASWKGRVLILQGLRDIQVGRPDAERLHEASPGSKLVLIPEANHVLKAVPDGDRAANIASYADPKLPLAPGIVASIAAFVAASQKAD